MCIIITNNYLEPEIVMHPVNIQEVKKIIIDFVLKWKPDLGDKNYVDTNFLFEYPKKDSNKKILKIIMKRETKSKIIYEYLNCYGYNEYQLCKHLLEKIRLVQFSGNQWVFGNDYLSGSSVDDYSK